MSIHETTIDDEGVEGEVSAFFEGLDDGDARFRFGAHKGKLVSLVSEEDEFYIPKILANSSVPEEAKLRLRRACGDLRIPLDIVVKSEDRFSWIEHEDGDLRLLFGKHKEVSLRELIRGGQAKTVKYYSELDFIPEDLSEKLQELLIDMQLEDR